MKTIEELRAREASLQAEIRRLSQKKTEDKSIVKKAVAEIRLIKLCVLYLDTAPSEEFVRESLSTYKRQEAIINKRYPAWHPDGATECKFKNNALRRAYYDNMMGLPKITDYIKTLNYLL